MQKEKKKWHFLFLLRNKRKANKRKDEYMTIRNSFGRPARSISLMVGIKLERHLWERNPILPFPRTEWSLLSRTVLECLFPSEGNGKKTLLEINAGYFINLNAWRINWCKSILEPLFFRLVEWGELRCTYFKR